MKTLFFQPGICPDLSFAELVSLNQRIGHPLHELNYTNNHIFAKTDRDDLSFANELGGTIRICEVQSDVRIDFIEDPSDCADEILNKLYASPLYEELETFDRLRYGITFIDDLPARRQVLPVAIKLLSARLKDTVKEEGRTARFVPLKSPTDIQLSSVQVEKNNLLTKGCEFVFIGDHDGYQLAKTVWVQPFEAFSYRDYGRPNRDDKSGMLPPKLARMLIQLARQEDTQSFLDPFCGSGSMLMEAAMMGLDATGVDISAKAIHDTDRNTEWLQKNIKDFPGTIKAIKGDAKHLHSQFDPVQFDACATEPYLGKPHSRPVEDSLYKKWSKDLLPLYRRALGEIRTVCKPGARVVFILPRFILSDKPGPGSIPIMTDLKFLGYDILDPLQNFEPTERRASIIYSRAKQVVQREIFVLQA